LEENRGKMTVQEACRRGGLKTSETHGEVFYREIGRKGGKTDGPKRKTKSSYYNPRRKKI
jgi:general stress protein YciG